MSSSQSDTASPIAERYRPRSMAFLGLRLHGGLTVKHYAISAQDLPLDPASIHAACGHLDREAPADTALGFVILHHGEEALWLLLHWWMPGGILAGRLWMSPLGEAVSFTPVDRPLMACVWELVPIAFERSAYVETIMNGSDCETYLARVMPDGSY